jgi:hypothetical protein
MQSVTITLPLPPAALKPNARPHWAAKAKAVKQCRRIGRVAAIAALAGAPPPRWMRASVLIEAYFPTARHWDPDNLVSSCKAYFDSFQDAGLVENDRELWPERPVIGKDKDNPRLVLTIREIIEAKCDAQCTWTYDDWHGYYDTACGDAFWLAEEWTQKFQFCPYCGKKIKLAGKVSE